MILIAQIYSFHFLLYICFICVYIVLCSDEFSLSSSVVLLYFLPQQLPLFSGHPFSFAYFICVFLYEKHNSFCVG